jgi:hypothetical protein
MARVILDECVDRRLAPHLAGHAVSTVHSRRWAGLSDAALLRRCAGEVDVFVTSDGNLQYQQNVEALPFGVLVLPSARRLDELLTHLPAIQEAIDRVRNGQLLDLSAHR